MSGMNGGWGIYSRTTGRLLRKGKIVDNQFEPPATPATDEMLYVWLDDEPTKLQRLPQLERLPELPTTWRRLSSPEAGKR